MWQEVPITSGKKCFPSSLQTLPGLTGFGSQVTETVAHGGIQLCFKQY